MNEDRTTGKGIKRRDFLRRASVGATAISASGFAFAEADADTQTAGLPTVSLGPHRITRLVAGYNPIGGFSHATPYLSRHMREYFTVERTVEYLDHCENLGINTCQLDLTEKVEKVLDILWSRGSQLKFICLHMPQTGGVSIERIAQYKAIAVAHHGGATDGLFRAGKSEGVRDYVKSVKDAGLLAGVSTHDPANIAKMEDEGWEVDFYMACFHRLSRTRGEMLEEFGAITVGEPFIDSDPGKMAAVIRQTDKPCLVFKILAAGRKCGTQRTVGRAFKYAFQNIKPNDALIVGMFPVHEDEVMLNVAHTRTFGVA